MLESEKYVGVKSDSTSTTNLYKILEEIQDEKMREKVKDYIYAQDDEFCNQYCNDTEYFYVSGIRDGIRIIIEGMKDYD